MAVILTFDLSQSSHPLNPGSLPKSWSILSSRTPSGAEGHPGSIPSIPLLFSYQVTEIKHPHPYY